MLPVAIQTTRGVELRVIDMRVEPMQAKAGPTGTATLITQRPVDPAQLWSIERLVVKSTSLTRLALTVTDGTDLRDYGALPVGFPQVAEYPRGLTLLGSQTFTLTATGAAPGDIVTASVQYSILQRVPA